jgi:hypothetical protein
MSVAGGCLWTETEKATLSKRLADTPDGYRLAYGGRSRAFFGVLAESVVRAGIDSYSVFAGARPRRPSFSSLNGLLHHFSWGQSSRQWDTLVAGVTKW